MLVSGELSLDLDKLETKVRGKKVDLTLMEFELVKYLIVHSGQAITREVLLEKVWGYEHYGDIRTVDVTVRRIRNKIEQDISNPKIILTKRGVGYYIGELKMENLTINHTSSENQYLKSNRTDRLDKYKKEIEEELGVKFKDRYSNDIYNRQDNLTSNEKETIELWNEKIVIDTSYIEFYKLKKKFNDRKQKIKEYWMKNYNTTIIKNLFTPFDELNRKCINEIEEQIKELAKKNIYTKSVNDFYNSGYYKIKRALNEITNEYSRLSSIAVKELEREGFNKSLDIRYNRINRTIFSPTSGERQKMYSDYMQDRKNIKMNYIEQTILKKFRTDTYKIVLEGIDEFYDELLIDYINEVEKTNERILMPYIYKYKQKEIDNMFQNLRIIIDKKKVLVEILRINLLEKKAYMYMIENGLFDVEVLNLCEKVYINDELKNEIENIVKYENNISENYINALALLKNKSKEKIYNEIEESHNQLKEEEQKEQQIIKEQRERDYKDRKELENIENIGKIAKWIIWIIFFLILSAIFSI